MKIGWRVRDKQGDEGVIVALMNLAQVTREEGGEPLIGDEDIPYLMVKRPNGSTFFAWEGDCKVMRD